MWSFLRILTPWLLLSTLLVPLHSQQEEVSGELIDIGEIGFDEDMTITLNENSGKFVCFAYRVECVEYTFRVTPSGGTEASKIMVFVTTKENAKRAAETNATRVKSVQNSVTRDSAMDTDEIDVSTSSDHCVMLINKKMESPPFQNPSAAKLEVHVKIRGCPTTSQKIIALTVPIIAVVLFSACFSVWWIRRKKARRSRPNTQDPQTLPHSMPQGVPPGVPPDAMTMMMYQQQMAAYGGGQPPRGPPPMMVANIDPSMLPPGGLQQRPPSTQPSLGPQTTTPWTGAQQSSGGGVPDTANLPRF